MALRSIRCRLLVVAAGGLLAVACAAEPEVTTEGDELNAEGPAAALSTLEAVARATQWSDAKLQYCWAKNGGSNHAAGNFACSEICRRKSNPEWDPYRSDCSGLVSWAWGLPAPGRTTKGFFPFQGDITTEIPAKDLRPGDAVNSSTHIMLFKEWVKPGARAVFIEEPGCGSRTPYARETTSDVTLKGSEIKLSYGATFTAIRYTKLKEGDATSAGPSRKPVEEIPASPEPVASAWAKGALDTASCTTLGGWAMRGNLSAVDIELSFFAPLGRPGAQTIETAANVRRAELPADKKDYGFVAEVPLALKDGKPHPVYAYAVDGKGNALQLGEPRTITCAGPPLPLAADKASRRAIPAEALAAWKLSTFADVAPPAAAAIAIATGPEFPLRPLAVASEDDPKQAFVIDGELRRPIDPAGLEAWRLIPVARKASDLASLDEGPAWPKAPFVVQDGKALYFVDAKLPEGAGSRPSALPGDADAPAGDSDGQPAGTGRDRKGDGDVEEPAEADAPEAESTASAGCAAAPGSTSGTGAAALLVLVTVVAARRRRIPIR